MSIQIRRATLQDLEAVTNLFDLYRQFYQQPSDIKAARDFLKERLEKNESVIFVATDADQIVGFTQLFRGFTSIGLKRTWLLNDLYVLPTHRRIGVAALMIQQATEFSQESGARNISLQTAKTNQSAQKLYEKLGWKREEHFLTYMLFH